MTGSWLSGPESVLGRKPELGEYRGDSLGLPETGPGSLAGSWQRCLGLLVDWLMCGGVSLLFVRFTSPHISTVVLAVWFVIGAVTVALFSFTPGQFVVGLRVVRVDGRTSIGVVRAVARQVLIVFIVPPLLNDGDGRGLHDRATQTALVRSR
ncbi:RDD family protein [Williamsia sterculiae]|uniref:RDD family protein n=2 Tax=Williamsia sterculiae TaxID=1344003 RepID=A0A1N7GAN2_9NOCA|nr:RDD family protein [Williamsia sterculiae]